MPSPPFAPATGLLDPDSDVTTGRLTGLCTFEDVIARMADMGLSTASEEDSVTVELVERKILQANKQIEMKLTQKLQKVLSPSQMDYYGNTPADLISRITDTSIAYLNECAITFVIRGCLEEGQGRMRFRFQEAGSAIDPILKRWDGLCEKEFEAVCPLLTFDQDGSGSVTLIERLLMSRQSSIRVTC